MSQITLSANASGSAIFTVAAPGTSTNQTLTLPDASGTLSTGIISGTAVATTSGTSFDFTGIPPWAKRITAIFSGVSLSAGANFLVQLGSSSGIVSSGYFSSLQWGTTTPTVVTSTAGFIIGGVLSSGFTSGACQIFNITANTWVATALSSVNGGTVVTMGGGTVNVGAVVDRVRITNNGGNTFVAGTINIMYEG